MSFTVNLYRFSKKENSTARPGSDPATFACRLREPSGILNPSIMLDLGLVTDPSGYNYAYIPEYGRYYWINEWTFERACWTASMSVDVLASWKDYIGAETMYVLRSSAAYDGDVMDRHYPAKVTQYAARTYATNPWNISNITDGCYVIGVVSRSGSHGSIQYWALTPANMRALSNALMTDLVTATNLFSEADASFALQKSLIDPFSYIKSCVWVPFSAVTASGQLTAQNLIVFDYGFNSVYGYDFPQNRTGTVNGSITIGNIPRHPQAGSRGTYMNVAPFTQAEIVFPPFGVIPIDTLMLANNPAVTLNYRFDCITGSCILEVVIGESVTNRLEAQVGVPIQLSQVRTDIMGIASGLTGTLGSAFTGNVMGAAAGIGSTLESMLPRISSMGSAGGWGDLLGDIVLNQYFTLAADEDIQHHGRPLCKNRVISSIPGYILVQDGDVSIPGTIDENTSIKAYLEGGFFYE